jgi:hypothetical protein
MTCAGQVNQIIEGDPEYRLKKESPQNHYQTITPIRIGSGSAQQGSAWLTF